MTTANFQFAPAPSVDMVNKKRRCTPAWQKWFIDLVGLVQSIKTTGISTVVAAHKFLVGPTSGADALPTFRVIVNADLPITTPTVPAELTLAGSVASPAGALTFDKATQSANLVWAGPTSGAAAKPTFRSLVAADVPGGLSGFGNPTAKVGTAVVNGAATTAMRSDAAPPIDQTLASTWTNVIGATGSPLAAAATQAQTGLAAYKPSDTTAANNTLTADTTLQLTFNETGKYAVEIWLPFYEATLGTGGFQFDLGSGTATVANLVLGVDGFSTASVINAGITSTTTVSAAASVATSSSAPSWFLAKGSISITGTGTLAVRWAQNSTLGADPTTLKAGAYFLATKIG